MTIDAGWIKLLKKGAPHAFTATAPFAPAVVFIDGQIKLMKSDAIRTWEGFLKCQFLATIEHAFGTGAKTVVLGFDDYQFVPVAKSMTQRKRMSSVEAIEFNLGQELPPCIPDCWAAAIKNRAFKSQVVGFVLRNLRARYRDETARTLVLDYMGAPEVLGKALVLPGVFYDEAGDVRTDLRRGECDVKAWAWAELGPLQIQSIDGDFVPIGMLQLAQHTTHRVCLHRMRTRVRTATVTKENTKREYEFVDVRKLVTHVGGELRRSQDPVRDLAAMIAAVGCDFTMNLPYVGPTKLWQMRAEARGALADREGLWRFLVHTFLHMYQKHVKSYKSLHDKIQRAVREDEYLDIYKQIYTQVRASGAAPRTRDALWAPSRLQAHVGNTLWTLGYWERLERAADPLEGNHGYVKVKNHVTYVL